MAKQIADAASYLDFLKRSHCAQVIAEAKFHVNTLHSIAEYLAEDRVGELYLSDIKVSVGAFESQVF